MRVCLLNDSFPPLIDGVANTVYNYADILSADAENEVLVGTPKYPDVDYDVYPFTVVPYQSTGIFKSVFGYRAGNPLATKSLAKMVQFRPDIIHSHCPVVSTMVARILRSETDVPVVFTYHTKFDQDIARGLRLEILQKGSFKFLVDNVSACDEVWVVSRGAGENLRSLGYEGTYRVVENGVDFPRGQKDEAFVRETVKGYYLPDGVPVYLFVGRMMNYKGLPLIIKALAQLQAAGQDFRMVFIGDGKDLPALKDAAADSGIAGKVIFTGAIRDREALRAWNTRADLFLFPSTYDTNGIVVREAAACGLASILIRDSCAAEGVTDGRNGFLIDETPEALCAQLLALGNDTDVMRQAGEHAMNEIYISWEDSVRNAHALYGEIIENKKAGRYERSSFTVTDRLAEMAAGIEQIDAKLRRMPGYAYDKAYAGLERAQDRAHAGFEKAHDKAVAGISMAQDMAKNGLRFTGEQIRNGIMQLWEDDDL